MADAAQKLQKALKEATDWVTYVDGQGRTYYFSEAFQCSSWEKPPNFESDALDETRAMLCAVFDSITQNAGGSDLRVEDFIAWVAVSAHAMAPPFDQVFKQAPGLLFHELDIDGDGILTRNEFCEGLIAARPHPHRNQDVPAIAPHFHSLFLSPVIEQDWAARSAAGAASSETPPPAIAKLADQIAEIHYDAVYGDRDEAGHYEECLRYVFDVMSSGKPSVSRLVFVSWIKRNAKHLPWPFCEVLDDEPDRIFFDGAAKGTEAREITSAEFVAEVMKNEFKGDALANLESGHRVSRTLSAWQRPAEQGAAGGTRGAASWESRAKETQQRHQKLISDLTHEAADTKMFFSRQLASMRKEMRDLDEKIKRVEYEAMLEPLPPPSDPPPPSAGPEFGAWQ